MKVSIHEACICKGSPTVGSEYAYTDLVEKGAFDIFGDAELVPVSRPELRAFDAEPKGEHEGMKFLDDVMFMSKKLYQSTSEKMLDGYFPITVGGDHSIAIGTIAGASRVYQDIHCIYIDGHTDINTDKTTLSGMIHGMPLAAAMGLCPKELTVGKKQNISGENIFIIGARSIDEGEYSIIEENGVKLYTADCVREKGIEAVMAEVMDSIGSAPVHISFDVDFLDRSIFSSTGYRMDGGLDIDTLKTVLEASFSGGGVSSLDIVEYNPVLDRDGCDRETVKGIIAYIRDMLGKYGCAQFEKATVCAD